MHTALEGLSTIVIVFYTVWKSIPDLEVCVVVEMSLTLRTWALYTVALPSTFSLLANFLSAPSFCPALVLLLQMCLVQVSLLSTVTPKISSSSFSGSSMSPKNGPDLVGFLFLEVVRTLHLHGSNVTFHLSAQFLILSRFRLVVTHLLSLLGLISQNRVASSAHRYHVFSH